MTREVDIVFVKAPGNASKNERLLKHKLTANWATRQWKKNKLKN